MYIYVYIKYILRAIPNFHINHKKIQGKQIKYITPT